MRIKVFESEKTLAGAAAEVCASQIRKKYQENENAAFHLCLGADKINVEMMRELVTEDVSWKNVHVHFSWEFAHEQGTSAISRRKRITYNLTDKLTSFLPENLHFSDTDILNTDDSISKLNSFKENFDLMFVELLPGGGICINLPPCNFDTRAAYIAAKDFLGSDCITVSPYKLLSAKKIVALASSMNMANTVGLMFESELSANVPSTILREHPDFMLLLDKDAAAKVPQYYF